MPVTISEDITGVASVNSGAIGGRRNIMYNGEMKVAQRSASETGLGAASGYFTLDRWYMYAAASAGRFTMAQVADGPPGFANCLKISTTTADTSIAAEERLNLWQRFEGQDLQQLKKGTASAEQVTVSFWIKGNAAALYVCELYDQDNGRSITQSFAVTTSWNRIELTFPGDTSDPLDDDINSSLLVVIWLHAGSDFTGGTFAVNTWNDQTAANRYAVADRTSIFDATSRTFFLTGVQMEVGATATDFESRTYGEELALCQRYFEILSYGLSGSMGSTVASAVFGKWAVSKRADPTITYGATANNWYIEGVDADSAANIAATTVSTTNMKLILNGMTSATIGMPVNHNGTVIASAEL
jgi:hypothetical protein